MYGAVLFLWQVKLHDFVEVLVEVMLVLEASVELPDLFGSERLGSSRCLIHD